MDKIIKTSLIVGISILYLIVTFISSIYVHEFTHVFQYRDIPKENAELCVSPFLTCEINGGKQYGYYTFTPTTQEGYEEGLKINPTSEFYAYLIQSIFFSVFWTILLIVMIKILKGGYK